MKNDEQQSLNHGRGRPKIGEDRALNKNALSARKYREDNDQWKEYNRIKQAEWSEKNPERKRQISREYYARKKLRATQTK